MFQSVIVDQIQHAYRQSPVASYVSAKLINSDVGKQGNVVNIRQFPEADQIRKARIFVATLGMITGMRREVTCGFFWGGSRVCLLL